MWTEQKLDGLLTTPSERLIEDVKKLNGDLMILGAGGKMGPTLSALAKKAMEAAGSRGKVIAVSRFGDPFAVKLLEKAHIGCISCDLLETGALDRLPDCENIVFMAGRKFGTSGQEHLTWAMNAVLPARVIERFKTSRIVAFSSGNLYPMRALAQGGADETVAPDPIGEYAMSCLARERIFEYGSTAYGTKACLYRLNYAVDLRYGVLYDIAKCILEGRPVPLSAPAFNCVWQGWANEAALRCLLYCQSPINRINITGPEILSVRETALKLGALLGKEVFFEGEEQKDALLNDASKAFGLLGRPEVSADELVRWQAQWLISGGRALDKPTHFEQKRGKF